jgi:nucleolar pre-ribosomal-associated protein 1
MLYSMLYNSSDDWKKERGWIIRFLSDGMTSTEDWRVFKRRHTWEILSSMFQSSETDYALRNGVLEACSFVCRSISLLNFAQVLTNLTRNSQATTSLILKSSLLTWIEMQLKSVRDNEAIAWVKIMENIITVVEPAKLETSTGGEWRSAVCRTLLLLLPNNKPGIILS